jgi:hypothetical protein
MHQKWFWNVRFDEWALWEAQMEEADGISDAYGGMTILPGTCPRLNRSVYSSPQNFLPVSPNSFPASSRIFPRSGDISALRDPYSANIDRCFSHFPLWTVHKKLYMFDMHHRSSKFDRTTPKLTVDTSESPVSDEATDYPGNVTSASDSDETLVSETLESGLSICKDECPRQDGGSGGDSNCHTWDGARAWEISWYARWELLRELVKRDEAKRNVLDCTATTPCEPSPMFFFAGDDEEDDEDYGTIVANPLFGRRIHAELGWSQGFLTKYQR